MSSSSLNPNAQPWQPGRDDDQKASPPTKSQAQLLNLPHEIPFLTQPMQPKQQNGVALLPPHLLIGSPSTMQQQQHVNHHHFPQTLCLPASAASKYCFVYSYDTHLQPKTYRFHPKRVVFEEVKSHDRDVAKEETQAAEKGQGLEKLCDGETKGSHGGQKMIFRRKFWPPRLMRAKGRFALGGFEKKIEIKQIWRPTNVKSDDGLVDNFSSSPPLLPPTENVTSNTTVMIKNIPNMFRRDTLMGFLDECCRNYQMEYDFLYLPMDFRTLDNLGYAFVNFTTIPAAMKFKEVLQNYKWGGVYGPYGLAKSKKVCEITWARIQGKHALVKHFEKSEFPCNTIDYLPVILAPARNGSNSTALQVIGKLCIKSVSPRRRRN